jgi:cellulose synthase/poly-beta-1,6-N-acetylglucosamine synthase-like glycosyltransferase
MESKPVNSIKIATSTTEEPRSTETPTFSVMTPVYNGEAFFRRCFGVLREQTISDWEWVVVDDGSTDQTAEIVRSIDDDRIRFISYPENQGRGYARTSPYLLGMITRAA